MVEKVGSVVGSTADRARGSPHRGGARIAGGEEYRDGARTDCASSLDPSPMQGREEKRTKNPRRACSEGTVVAFHASKGIACTLTFLL